MVNLVTIRYWPVEIHMRDTMGVFHLTAKIESSVSIISTAVPGPAVVSGINTNFFQKASSLIFGEKRFIASCIQFICDECVALCAKILEEDG